MSISSATSSTSSSTSSLGAAASGQPRANSSKPVKPSRAEQHGVREVLRECYCLTSEFEWFKRSLDMRALPITRGNTLAMSAAVDHLVYNAQKVQTALKQLLRDRREFAPSDSEEETASSDESDSEEQRGSKKVKAEDVTSRQGPPVAIFSLPPWIDSLHSENAPLAEEGAQVPPLPSPPVVASFVDTRMSAPPSTVSERSSSAAETPAPKRVKKGRKLNSL